MRRPDVFTLDYSHPLAQGLAWAGLMQAPGTAVLQDALSRNNFSLINMESSDWVRDDRGALALQFDGSDERAETSTAVITSGLGYSDISGSFVSFCCWFRPSALTADTHIFTLGGYNQYRWAALKSLGAQAGDPVSLFHGGSIANAEITSTTLLNGDTTSWHHACGVFSSNHREFWLNGVLQGTNSTNVGLSGSNSPIAIGCRAYTTTRQNFFAGAVSDPLIWANRRLSPAEIALLADRTDPMLGGLVREVNPVSYFDFGASAPADITGTLSVAESGTDTFAATGQLHDW